MVAVVALVVLGPDKLPAAARQIGQVMRQIRKISTGFQQELQNALNEPLEEEARERGRIAVEESKANNQPAPDAPEDESEPKDLTGRVPSD